ncbi:MAG: ABC transporter substrate-binding protein, partial [Methylobacterium sp.]
MNRRDFLATGTIAAIGLAAPRIARAQDARILRFVPQANLSSLDAIAGTQYVVRNASLLVWDTLFGLDHTITARPQMVEAYENSPDFKDWTFKLRPGLKFHDGEPVLGRDVVASLQRWMVRDTMGQRIKASLLEMTTPDDRTVRIRLDKPFPKMLFALGKQNAPVAEIMPERIAKTDPFKLITEYVGSGPMKFAKDEWVPGSKAVFTRFADYQP